MSRPRAADDFATIRARLREIRGEPAQPSRAETETHTEELGPGREAERRMKERREGAPPPWVPTIFFTDRAER